MAEMNEQTVDQFLAEVQGGTQEYFESAGDDSRFKRPDDGDYTTVITKVATRPYVDPKTGSKVGLIDFHMTLVDPSEELASEFPQGFILTSWGNSFDDQRALKQLARLKEEDFESNRYGDAVLAAIGTDKKKCVGDIVEIELGKKKGKYKFFKFNDLVGNVND